MHKLFCCAKEKCRNSRVFVKQVHWSMRMFTVYSIIILCKNAAAKRTVLPKVVKQNDVSHYFWKKLSKLDVSQNTRKKWRISIKVDEIRHFCLVFWWDTTKLFVRIPDFFDGNCGRSEDFLLRINRTYRYNIAVLFFFSAYWNSNRHISYFCYEILGENDVSHFQHLRK